MSALQGEDVQARASFGRPSRAAAGYRAIASSSQSGCSATSTGSATAAASCTTAVIDAIVADMKANAPDHIAVTGDLVNLALDREIELARLWLETLGDPHDVSVVPGNHDAYVPGALDRVCRAWGPWMSGDDAKAPVDRQSFPYLRVRGKVALIGATSARATAPFMANGFFRDDQAHRLGRDPRRGRQARPVPRRDDPPPAGAQRRAAAQAAVRHRQFPERRSAATAPSWCCTAIRICRRCTGSTARRARCRWSASPPPARRRAARKPAAQYNLIDIDGRARPLARAADAARPDRPGDAAGRARGASTSMPSTSSNGS